MFLFALIIWETKVLDCLVWTVGSLFQLLFLSLLYFQVLQALVSFPSACRWVRISSAFCLRVPHSSLDLLLFFSQSRSLRQELALRVYMVSPWLSSPQSPRSSHGLSIRQPPLSETALAKSPTSKPMSTSQSLLHRTFLKKKNNNNHFLLEPLSSFSPRPLSHVVCLLAHEFLLPSLGWYFV